MVRTNGLEGKFNFWLLFFFFFFFKPLFDSRVRECDGTESPGWVNWFVEYKVGWRREQTGLWWAGLWLVCLLVFVSGRSAVGGRVIPDGASEVIISTT